MTTTKELIAVLIVCLSISGTILGVASMSFDHTARELRQEGYDRAIRDAAEGKQRMRETATLERLLRP